jgi:hypothetical protein
MIGQHIRALKGGRWIHAIDCGDETVLHLAEDTAPRRVRRAYRPEFVAGAESIESVTHRERTFPPGEVVRRAYSRAADPTLATMFRDSEAFAEWCTTGWLGGPRNVAVGLSASAPGPGPRANGAAAAAVAVKAAARAARARPAAEAKPATKARPARRPATGQKRKAAAPKGSGASAKRRRATPAKTSARAKQAAKGRARPVAKAKRTRR